MAETKEKPFQEVANEHGHNAAEWMREALDDEEQRDRITENALEVQVRSGWYSPGDEKNAKPVEYFILLGTGGPATRIKGELDEYGQPETANFEYQDWFKPWTAANNLTDEEAATLLEYARQFYFGD
jgi:hypothetical protein